MTLTNRLLDALEEALTARLAGGLDDGLDQRDYKDALRWVRTQMADRKRHRKHERKLIAEPFRTALNQFFARRN